MESTTKPAHRKYNQTYYSRNRLNILKTAKGGLSKEQRQAIVNDVKLNEAILRNKREAIERRIFEFIGLK